MRHFIIGNLLLILIIVIIITAEENSLNLILQNFHRVMGTNTTAIPRGNSTNSNFSIDYCIQVYHNQTVNILCKAEKDGKECKGPPDSRKVSYR